jgi:hypothetical protein
MSYPALDMALLFTIMLTSRRLGVRSGRPFMLLGAGVLLWVVGDSIWSYLVIHNLYQPGDISGLFYLTDGLFFTATAYVAAGTKKRALDEPSQPWLALAHA